MRIDAHQHFWAVARGDYFWMSPDLKPLYRDYHPEDLRPLLDTSNIDATILVQAADTVGETRFMLDIAKRTDWVAGVVGWVNMEDGTAVETLDGLMHHPKFVGIRPMIQDIEDDLWMLKPELAPAFRELIDRNLTFDALVFPRHLPHLLSLLSRHPDLQCVIDHGAKPQIRDGAFDAWSKDMARLASETPALCKVSGLVTEAGEDWTIDSIRPYVEHLFETFGPQRMMFGSDWPVLNLVGTYERWEAAVESLTSGLSDTERDAFFGGNAKRFYLSRSS